VSFLAYKFRIKDASTCRHLRRHAVACNQVWNFCVATQRESERRWKAGKHSRWPTAIDLCRLTQGSAHLLGIHSDTVNRICRAFTASRDQHRRCPKFRSSAGPRRSLGWIAIVPRAVQIAGAAVTYMKRAYRFWMSRDAEGVFKSGAFVEDARGRWYFTMTCEVEDNLFRGNGNVGIDLGLRDLATTSDGDKIPALRHYRQHADALAVAQRAGNKKRARAINAKIANARRHHLHEQSTRIARENNLIVVGDVNAAVLAKTKMAKSVLDAGWASFRHMLRYKAARRQAVYVDADERWSSQTCSACGCIPASSPKGMGALGMRRWDCSDCGASHDRDVNAARNILRVGLECQPPVGEIASVHAARRH